jgi:hypothetical protein
MKRKRIQSQALQRKVSRKMRYQDRMHRPFKA